MAKPGSDSTDRSSTPRGRGGAESSGNTQPEGDAAHVYKLLGTMNLRGGRVDKPVPEFERREAMHAIEPYALAEHVRRMRLVIPEYEVGNWGRYRIALAFELEMTPSELDSEPVGKVYDRIALREHARQSVSAVRPTPPADNPRADRRKRKSSGRDTSRDAEVYRKWQAWAERSDVDLSYAAFAPSVGLSARDAKAAIENAGRKRRRAMKHRR